MVDVGGERHDLAGRRAARLLDRDRRDRHHLRGAELERSAEGVAGDGDVGSGSGIREGQRRGQEPRDGDEREVVLAVEGHHASGQCGLTRRLDDRLGDAGDDVRVGDDAVLCDDESAAREVAAALVRRAGDPHHGCRCARELGVVDAARRQLGRLRRSVEHLDEPGDALAERGRAQLREEGARRRGRDLVEGREHPRPRHGGGEHGHPHGRDAGPDEGDHEGGDQQVADRPEHAVEHAELHGLRAMAERPTHDGAEPGADREQQDRRGDRRGCPPFGRGDESRDPRHHEPRRDAAEDQADEAGGRAQQSGAVAVHDRADEDEDEQHVEHQAPAHVRSVPSSGSPIADLQPAASGSETAASDAGARGRPRGRKPSGPFASRQVITPPGA